MKRKMLLVMEAIQMNGAVTGWLGYLGAIDRREWDVDLFLFDPELHDGLELPRNVRLLPADPHCVIERVGLMAALRYTVRRGRFDLLMKRLFYSLFQHWFSRFEKWNLACSAMCQQEHYDVAIGGALGASWAYVVHKVSASVKLVWLDTDVRNVPWARYWSYFKHYVGSVQGLVCVSKAIRDQMRKDNPLWAEKIFMMNYVIDAARIKKLASESSGLPEKKAFRLVTVGRYCQQKGQFLVPGIATELLRRGLNFEWYLIGPGYELNRAEIEANLQKYGLRERLFFFEGMLNPFAAMATADLYVQPSIFEGYGLTVSEALVTGRYVIASDIPSFREQIESEQFGLLAKVGDERSFAEAIMKGCTVIMSQGRRTCYETPYSAMKTYNQFCQILQEVSR